MNRITYILFLFIIVALLNTGCRKEFNQEQNPNVDCIMKIFSVPSWYTDSISYKDNKIISIDKSYRVTSDNNTHAQFEYDNNEVKITVSYISQGSQGIAVNYTCSYDGSKIIQIDTNDDRVKANYFYDNDNLKYILYHKDNNLTDSITVEYDNSGKNIANASWYRFDQASSKLQLIDSANYTYDNKINPHRNSIHFLYDFYDCKEYSLDYFNTNNIRTIETTEGDYYTDYTYNQYDYPTYVIFYDADNQETDRNAIEYQSN